MLSLHIFSLSFFFYFLSFLHNDVYLGLEYKGNALSRVDLYNSPYYKEYCSWFS